MKLFSFLLRVSPVTVVLAITAGIVSGASSTGLLAVIGSSLTRNTFQPYTVIWAFVGLCLLMPFARFCSDYLLCRLGQKAVYDLRIRLSHQILATPLRQLEKIGPHRLLATLTDDITAIISAMLFIPLLCINLAIVVGCVIYLGWLSPTICLMVLGFMVLGIGVYQLPVIKGVRLQRRARDEADALFNHFRALTEGTKELKLHRLRRESFLGDSLQSTAASLRRSNVAAMAFFIAATSIGQILFFVFTGMLIFVLPTLRTIPAEVLTVVIIIMLYMMGPLDTIMTTLANLSRASIAYQRVEQLGLSLAPSAAPALATHNRAAAHNWELLELSGVTHAYHHEKENRSFILGPIDLTIFPEELIFITGGNGSGKTTLAKILTGLYLPESGEIRLGGEIVNDETVERYRQHFSAVFSDFYLFESLLGMGGLELDETALKYLTQLHLNHKVEVKDGILSTTELSRGQRKRLALLVAYLEDRPIYVFDEWAADQDPQFKETFYSSLLPALRARGKTVVVITHDDRYYHLADRVIKLEDGKLYHDQQTAFSPLASINVPTH